MAQESSRLYDLGHRKETGYTDGKAQNSWAGEGARLLTSYGSRSERCMACATTLRPSLLPGLQVCEAFISLSSCCKRFLFEAFQILNEECVALQADNSFLLESA